MKKVLLLAGIAGMVAANAQAIDATPYVGLDLGYAMTDADTTLSKAVVLSDSSYSLSGVVGARTERFGLEYFYDAGIRAHKNNNSTRISGMGVDALAFQDLGCSGRWELVGSAGIADVKIKAHLNNADNYSDHGLAYRLGAGVQYAVSEKTTFRAMYNHSWINGSHLDALDEFTVGFRYSF
ncbi:MAG: porin family protein [Alphaproteobacteria bacterium]|nr:porin family protein [Alphaproteobacteria bacterium]